MLHMAVKRIKKWSLAFEGCELVTAPNVKLNAVEQKYITEEYIKKTNNFGATFEFYTVL